MAGVVNIAVAVVFSIYVLSQKERLGGQGRRILKAYLPEKTNVQIIRVLGLLNHNFNSFISGQCLEAVILGVMFVVTLTVFRIPYALLIGVLIAFLALIPIVGAFIGCFVGAFLILVDSPAKAAVFVIIFLVLQQIEGNLIYPHVVGNSVGLPSMWVAEQDGGIDEQESILIHSALEFTEQEAIDILTPRINITAVSRRHKGANR